MHSRNTGDQTCAVAFSTNMIFVRPPPLPSPYLSIHPTSHPSIYPFTHTLLAFFSPMGNHKIFGLR
jgi:hypothetical protein